MDLLQWGIDRVSLVTLLSLCQSDLTGPLLDSCSLQNITQF